MSLEDEEADGQLDNESSASIEPSFEADRRFRLQLRRVLIVRSGIVTKSEIED